MSVIGQWRLSGYVTAIEIRSLFIQETYTKLLLLGPWARLLAPNCSKWCPVVIVLDKKWMDKSTLLIKVQHKPESYSVLYIKVIRWVLDYLSTWVPALWPCITRHVFVSAGFQLPCTEQNWGFTVERNKVVMDEQLKALEDIIERGKEGARLQTRAWLEWWVGVALTWLEMSIREADGRF